MKKSALLFVLIITALMATACGGSTPAATEAPVQPTATVAPAQPAGTEAVVSSGGATTVEITLDDNTISSSLDYLPGGCALYFCHYECGTPWSQFQHQHTRFSSG